MQMLNGILKYIYNNNMEKQEIYGISFVRRVNKNFDGVDHVIILHLRKEIPDMGYSSKQIRKLLKKY